MTKSELAKAIKASRLHKLYHSPTGEVSREAPAGVNATGQATDRLMALQRSIKVATARETDFPPELRNDADELRELIQTGIVTLFADSEDGEISPADFKTIFDPLAGMAEGLLAALHHDDPQKMVSLRSMKAECADKAFYRQLRRSLHEQASGRERMFALGKALASFSTHLFIQAEKGGHLPTGLVEEVGGIIDALNQKAARGVFDFHDEAASVRAWGLVEGAPMPSDKMIKHAEPAPPQLKKSPGGPTSGKPGKDASETDYKAAKADAEVVPPGLDQAPGNPKDTKVTKEPGQEGGGYAGLKPEVDGEKTEEPPRQPKVEAVEFLVRIPEKPGQMEWNIRCGGKRIGEAWRRVFLGGSEHHARVAADTLFEKLVEGVRSIDVTASDVFEMQTRVVDALNKVASELKVGRRFSIAR